MSDRAEKEDYEIFELGFTIIVFLGARGDKGLLLHHQKGRWDFHHYGSIAWDSFHQQVYRNFKAETLSLTDLEQRGIKMPALGEYMQGTRGLSWTDNFSSEAPFDKVPAGVLRKLKSLSVDPADVYLVLLEDFYETSLGDGRYLYPHSAFWAKSAALEEVRRLQTEETDAAKREWYRYYVKEVSLSVDKSKKMITASLNIEPYEHYSIDDVLRLLAARIRPQK